MRAITMILLIINIPCRHSRLDQALFPSTVGTFRNFHTSYTRFPAPTELVTYFGIVSSSLKEFETDVTTLGLVRSKRMLATLSRTREPLGWRQEIIFPTVSFNVLWKFPRLYSFMRVCHAVSMFVCKQDEPQRQDEQGPAFATTSPPTSLRHCRAPWCSFSFFSIILPDYPLLHLYTPSFSSANAPPRPSPPYSFAVHSLLQLHIPRVSILCSNQVFFNG